MTIQDMHIGVTLQVDRVASNSSEGLLPQEIDYYLNRAIEEFIKQQYSILKQEEKQLENQYVTENLRTLIKKENLILNTLTVSTEFKEFSLPSDYYYYLLLEYVAGNKKHNTTLRTHKGLKLYLTTNTNLPLFREYPFVIENDKIKIYFNQNDNQTNSFASLTYIKEPNVVSLSSAVNCNLPVHTHKQIVDIAANLILKDITRQ